RPADPEDPELPTPDLSPDFTIDTTDTDYTVFQITLPTDEAIGATRIIDAIATAHNTSRATAFTELLHGTAGEVKVTLNCHRNLDTGDMHLENHKLTGIAPGTWMRRVTDLTVPSHSTHHGRFATEAQKALIAGIDGTCRAPGCDNPAATADADHIHRYDNNPHTGTREMQSLCRRCHILKTLGLTDYTRLTDGTTIVSSIDDNHTVTTVPTGPLAHANLTFDRRLARKTSTRKEHQNLRDTWNYITRFAFQNVGASAIIVEEAPTPSS
ncbi:HNH endonuclease signature motif containing protein, partial [Corynebacterium variabile]|uniref:HNH endonuclease signature motif containing protein n=1 Tax=Corynebacterium variabile TaxID=1727 RepID=UPI0014770AEA